MVVDNSWVERLKGQISEFEFDAALQTLGEMRMQSSTITNQGGVYDE